MLTDLLQEIHNWFDLSRHTGTFTISGGTLTVDFLLPGQYYRVIGSVFNDGVHRYDDVADVLTDEEFTGAVWALGIPRAVLDLAEQIDEWRSKYENIDSQSMSPYSSESFGGYSYTKSSGNAASAVSGSTPSGWKAVFASNLNRWRKI